MNSFTHHQLTKSRNDKINQNIQVYVRVRPLNAREKLMRSNEIVEVSLPKDIICRHTLDSKVSKKFTFDRTFGPESKQADVYHTVVAPLIEEVLSGYNCTVFAYGQTGTGKTHTMIGVETPELKSSWEDDSLVGIIPRALCHLLDELRMMEVEYTMRISYLELYNEELCDLLSSDDSVKIRIYDDSTKKGSVIIQGLEEVIVHGKDDVYKLLEKGQERRKTATTLLNAQSSRSHTVFSILVHIRENGIDGEEMLKIGKLNLVDLAGSENISKAGNEKGIRTRETVNINQSLLTLGRVITALVERAPHVPYRESKLTRLLQESLGGRTKTSIIATISPGHKDIDETLSTLEYAHRAKNIQNKPEVNQKLTKKTVLKEYTEEIDRLKRDLVAARDKNGIFLAEETYNEMNYKLDNQNKELNEKILMIKVMKEEMIKKEELFSEVKANLDKKTEKLEKTERVLNEAKYALTQTKKALTTTKKRYKEKKIILGNHIETEEKLTNQASELIQVANVASNEHLLLQETLERRKNIDEKIKIVACGFQKKMENSYEAMNRAIQDLHEKHNSISMVITDAISKNTNTITSYINDTKININNIALHCTADFDNFYSHYDNCKKEILNGDEIYKNAFEKLYQEQRKKDELWKNKLNNYLKDVQNNLNEQKIIQEQNIQLLSALITEVNQKEIQFFETLSHHFQNIMKEAQNTLHNEKIKIENNASKGFQLNKKKSEILSTMEKLMVNLKELEIEDNSRNSDIQKISDNIASVEKEISTKVHSEIESINVFVDNIENDHNVIQNKFKVFQNDYHSNTSKVESEVKNVDDTISVFYNDNLEFSNQMKQMALDNQNNRRQYLDTDNNELNLKKASYISSLEYQCKQIENVMSEMQCHFDDHSIQGTCLVKSLDDTIIEYSDIYYEKMEENYNKLQAFSEKELKTYSPTGQTPAKKEFIYPKVLARTSPHTNIIKRFRLENDYSDLDISNTTISEDNETMNDYNEQMTSISTPIKILEHSTKSLDLNMDSLKENDPRLTNSLNIYENKNYNVIKTSSPLPLVTSNKENIG